LGVIIFHWPDHGLVQPGTHLDIASDGGHVDTCEVEALVQIVPVWTQVNHNNLAVDSVYVKALFWSGRAVQKYRTVMGAERHVMRDHEIIFVWVNAVTWVYPYAVYVTRLLISQFSSSSK
jgi:hypothetical protein